MNNRGVNETAESLEQLARIRAEVVRDGGSTVEREKLVLLCPDRLSVSEQFMCIAGVAQKENWSFAFLPGGGVRFGSYASPAGQTFPREQEA